VLGPSGSGKSTLTLCLDGLIPHLVEGDYSGQVTVAGLVVKDNPVHVLAQRVGLVFQDPEAQFCTLTVEDEIAFGLENLCRAKEDIEVAIDKSLATVGLSGFRKRSLTSLSGGEKQRVALASVLALEPQVLVLDEPSANLDPQGTAQLFGLVRRLAAERQHTIVIIEHKLDELIGWIDSVLVLGEEGRLLLTGEKRAVFYQQADALAAAGVWRPQTVELVQGLREAGWEVPGCPLTVEETASALAETPGLVDRLRAWKREETPTSQTANQSEVEPLLQATELTYVYPGSDPAAPVLREVSLALPKGSFLAVVGANGAGKSTLLSLLSGVLRPPRGRVFLEGRDVATMAPRVLTAKVGHVFQNPEHQFVSDTVAGELAYSLRPDAGPRALARLTRAQRGLVDVWLERLGLSALAEANPFSLSHGQKRRLSVAAMLIRGQSVLVLDEPTLGQDEAQAQLLMAMVEEFRARGGSVIMVTHDMRLVAEHADLVLVLREGRCEYLGGPQALFGREDLVERAGLAMPPVGRVSAALRVLANTTTGLHTVEAFLRAAGRNLRGFGEGLGDRGCGHA